MERDETMIVNDYKMLQADTGAGLMRKLERDVSKGWLPFGSPFFGVQGETPAFFQAVTKTKHVRGIK